MLIEQRETKQYESSEIKLIRQMEIFPYSSPINLSEEEKWVLAVTSFEATNSVFIKTNENKSFSITTPAHWSSIGGAETINELRDLLWLRAQNDIELPVEQIRKRGNLIKMRGEEYNLSDLDTL